MSADETDIVLSAIRRGEDSLPKLRAATGLEYAKLHPILHVLEFEKRKINRSETSEGFDRFAPTPTERNGGFKGTHWKDEQSATPVLQSLHSTRAAADARELALLQRQAPYCIGCRGLCLLNGTKAGRIQWRCRKCGSSFDGSGSPTKRKVLKRMEAYVEQEKTTVKGAV